ncbi:FliH/SctL family protein [Magnetococcus sp. PR-3]|uniref:FliH/SctL family protein n=1 Tax=Magnetococcus sp. PR-3 TaxID=3120355 RepID=UPI002FCE44D9
MTEKTPLYHDRMDDSVAGGFAALLNQEPDPLKGEFIGYLPNGRLPSLEVEEPEPIIEEEEAELRREEELERELYQRVFAAAEQAGMEAGLRKMEEEMAARVPRLEGIIRDLDGLPQRVFAASEQFMVESCMVLLRELLAHELNVNVDSLKARIHRLMKEVSTRDRMGIHLNPKDVELLGNSASFDGLEIVGDPMVPQGTARLESNFGGIEDDVTDRLAHMEQGIRAFLEERQEEPEVYEAAVGAGEIPLDDEDEIDEVPEVDDDDTTGAALAAMEAGGSDETPAEVNEMTSMGSEVAEDLSALIEESEEEEADEALGLLGDDLTSENEGDDEEDDDCIIGPGEIPGAQAVQGLAEQDEMAMDDAAMEEVVDENTTGAALAAMEAGAGGSDTPAEAAALTQMGADIEDDLASLLDEEGDDNGEPDVLADIDEIPEQEEGNTTGAALAAMEAGAGGSDTPAEAAALTQMGEDIEEDLASLLDDEPDAMDEMAQMLADEVTDEEEADLLSGLLDDPDEEPQP